MTAHKKKTSAGKNIPPAKKRSGTGLLGFLSGKKKTPPKPAGSQARAATKGKPVKSTAHRKAKPAAKKTAPAKKPAPKPKKSSSAVKARPKPSKPTPKPSAKRPAPASGKPAKASEPAAPPPPALRTPPAAAPVPAEVVAELQRTIARRRFRVDTSIRKPTPPSKLIPQATWDEVIFSIVSAAGKEGIPVEELCRRAIAVKYDKRDVRDGAATPYSRFHNSNITNIEAVFRYLDNPEFRAIYGYREVRR